MHADFFIAITKTARKQLANLLFFRSLETRRARNSAENEISAADNFPAEQQKQRKAAEGWLSGSRR
jgi:hypothetical protein